MPVKPRLEWRPQASVDLMLIVAEIADANPSASLEFLDEVESKVALPDHPRLYKRSPRVKGLREMVVRPNYVVFYRESVELIEIVNVVHARRQWPPSNQ
jgi:toxin ParE1/3/4